MGIFSGLEGLGLGKLKNIELYEEEKLETARGTVGGKGAKSAKKTIVLEKDVLLDKKYTCPLCDKEFTSKTVRTGKAKLLSADTDLRPKYDPVDSIKYEAVVCPHCGYAALNRFFERLLPTQGKLIKEQISKNFNGLSTYGETYTYDDAIMRYKLVLLNAVVKKGKMSERAYTCLKLAWLLRGKRETLPKETPNYVEVIKNLQSEEEELIKNAFEGFEAAFPKENFPMCGMDESTVTYLVAELARRCGNYDKANRWISQVITSRNTPDRVKEKARAIKELIKQDQQASEKRNQEILEKQNEQA